MARSDVRWTGALWGDQSGSRVDGETDREKTRELAHPVASMNGERPWTERRRERRAVGKSWWRAGRAGGGSRWRWKDGLVVREAVGGTKAG